MKWSGEAFIHGFMTIISLIIHPLPSTGAGRIRIDMIEMATQVQLMS